MPLTFTRISVNAMTLACALTVTEVLVIVLRQRLWFEPHWHAAALLLGCTRVRRSLVHHCNVAQLGEQAAQNCCVEGSTPSIATTLKVVTGKAERLGFESPVDARCILTARRKPRIRGAPAIPDHIHVSESRSHRSAYHALCVDARRVSDPAETVEEAFVPGRRER